jgi:hypothetical protein
VQLPALHWFYLYIVWFLPLVLVAVLAGEAPRARDSEAPTGVDVLEHGDATPVLSGAA